MSFYLFTRDFSPGLDKNINVFNIYIYIYIYNAHKLHHLLLKCKPYIELEMSKTENLSFLQSKNTYERISKCGMDKE